MSTPDDSPRTVIRSRTGEVLHTSDKATVREALEEAVAANADLGYADLRYARTCASRTWANLRFANLGSANLVGTTCLSVGLPSGHAILAPLPEGWRLTVGCWNGTVTDLRELIAKDTGWPEAEGDQIIERRPMLAALADMCDAWTATNEVVLQQVQGKWAPAKVEVPA